MKKNKALMSVMFLAVILALISTSCTPRKGDEKESEIKQLLNRAIQGIEKMEKEKRILKADLESAKKDKVVRENRSLKEELEKARKKNKELEDQISKLRGVAAHAQAQLESKEEKMSRVADLESENRKLQEQISKLKGLVSYSELQLQSKKEESARVAELEKEVSELKSLLQKINEIAGEDKTTVQPFQQ